jgi:hypothetical protein
MIDPPGYTVIEEAIGTDEVSLHGFGGSFGDPVGAVIVIDGHARVNVIVPPLRDTWPPVLEDRFRDTVRALAATYPYENEPGQVGVVFDPADIAIALNGAKVHGEVIDRA